MADIYASSVGGWDAVTGNGGTSAVDAYSLEEALTVATSGATGGDRIIVMADGDYDINTVAAITCTVAGTSVSSWLEIVGADSSGLNIGTTKPHIKTSTATTTAMILAGNRTFMYWHSFKMTIDAASNGFYYFTNCFFRDFEFITTANYSDNTKAIVGARMMGCLISDSTFVGPDGIAVRTSTINNGGITISGCTFDGFDWHVYQQNGDGLCVHDCYMRGAANAAIQLQSTTTLSSVVGNLIYENAAGVRISAGRNCVVLYNTIVDNTGIGIVGDGLMDPASLVCGNILADNGGVGADGDGGVFYNNWTDGNTGDDITGALYEEGTAAGTAPGFVDASTDDYTLDADAAAHVSVTGIPYGAPMLQNVAGPAGGAGRLIDGGLVA